MKISFRLKTILGIALIEALMLVLLIWLSLSQLDGSNRHALEERAQTTAALFATLAKDAVLSTDLASLESHVAAMMKNPGIVYVRVKAYGTTLAESGDAQPNDEVFDTAMAIAEGGETFGRIELGLSTSSIDNLVADSRRAMSGIALAEIALVAIFSFLLGTYLTRQIKTLTDGVHALTQGQVGFQIPVKGNDELAETAMCFNTMSTQLEQTQTALKAEVAHSQSIAEGLRQSEAIIRDHKENLEVRISERTAELRALTRSQHQLIEHANAPIFTLNHKLNVTRWNRKAAELTGIAANDALGQNADGLVFRHKGSTALRDACQAAALQGYLDEFEVQIPTENGARVWVLGVTAMRDAARNITGYVFVGQDITFREPEAPAGSGSTVACA